MTNYYTKNADRFGWGTSQTMAEYKIAELLPLLSGNKILDIGCGPGAFVDTLTNRGFDATGIDITSKFIAYARKNYKGKFIVGDAMSLPFENQTFDTVYVRNVLEHLDNDRKALKEALRVGKKVVLVVPQQTPSNLAKRGLIFSHYQDASHQRYYTVKEIKNLVESVHATLISTQFCEPLPAKSVVFEMLKGPSIFKRILIKLLFSLLPPASYHLEIIAIIKP